MSHCPSTCVRSIWLAALAASAVTIASGQDAPPAASTAGEAGIAGARREFQSVKSSDATAVTPKLALPRAATPDFHAGATAPGSSAAQKLKPTDKKSSNWLVDAMEKSERRDARSRERARDEKDPDSLTTESTAGDIDSAAARDERAPQSKTEAEERERKAMAAAANPLTPFLSEWMAPQDYALLKPGLRSAEGGLPDTGGFAAGGAVRGLDASRLLVPGLPGPATNATSVERAAPRENPYLQSLNTAAPAARLVAPPAPPPSNPAPVLNRPAPVVAPTVVPGKPKLPDFVKPANDDKYFKPLKRF